MSKRCSTESEDGGYISILYAYATANTYLDLALEYALKNDIVSRNLYFMAALVIIQLTTVDHPTNIRDKAHVDQCKATIFKKLAEFRVTHQIALRNDPCNSLAIPDAVKKIIKSFYNAWLPAIKEKLQVRGVAHLDKRQGKLISIVSKMRILRSVLEAIIKKINTINAIISSEFKQHVRNWSGPDFKHLKFRVEDNQVQERLTAVYNKRGYEKRCGNSQEDWFRKFHGRFFEKSIECVASNIVKTGSTPQDVLHFLIEMLEATVQFDGARPTALIPGGYLFGRSRCQPLQRVIEKWSGVCFQDLESADKKEKKTRLICFIRRKAQNMNEAPRNENENGNERKNALNANNARWGLRESEYVGNDRDEYKQEQAAVIASDANQIENSAHDRWQMQQTDSVDTGNIQHIDAYGARVNMTIMHGPMPNRATMSQQPWNHAYANAGNANKHGSLPREASYTFIKSLTHQTYQHRQYTHQPMSIDDTSIHTHFVGTPAMPEYTSQQQRDVHHDNGAITQPATVTAGVPPTMRYNEPMQHRYWSLQRTQSLTHHHRQVTQEESLRTVNMHITRSAMEIDDPGIDTHGANPATIDEPTSNQMAMSEHLWSPNANVSAHNDREPPATGREEHEQQEGSWACYYANHASANHENAHEHQNRLSSHGATRLEALSMPELPQPAAMIEPQPVRRGEVHRAGNACDATRYSAEYDTTNTRQQRNEQHAVTSNHTMHARHQPGRYQHKNHTAEQRYNSTAFGAFESASISPQQRDSSCPDLYMTDGDSDSHGNTVNGGRTGQSPQIPMKPAPFMSEVFYRAPAPHAPPREESILVKLFYQ